MSWKLADAKAKLSEVVNAALEEGPQRITRRNDAVVLIPEDEYRTLRGEKVSFVDYLTSAKDLDDLDLSRSPDLSRDIEL